jgi:transposase
MRSKIEPMKKAARMLHNQRTLLQNWFEAKGGVSSGAVEGVNTQAKLTVRKSLGFRTFHGAEVALYHVFGALPVPDIAYRIY